MFAEISTSKAHMEGEKCESIMNDAFLIYLLNTNRKIIFELEWVEIGH